MVVLHRDFLANTIDLVDRRLNMFIRHSCHPPRMTAKPPPTTGETQVQLSVQKLEESVVLLEMRRRIAPAIQREDCEATPKARASARAVLAKLLRHRVLRERNRVGLVGGVELHLARRRVVTFSPNFDVSLPASTNLNVSGAPASAAAGYTFMRIAACYSAIFVNKSNNLRTAIKNSSIVDSPWPWRNGISNGHVKSKRKPNRTKTGIEREFKTAILIVFANRSVTSH